MSKELEFYINENGIACVPLKMYNDSLDKIERLYNELEKQNINYGLEIERLNNIIKEARENNKYLHECNIELTRRNTKAIDFISFICFNSERPLTINECHKLYAILKGSDKE